MIAVEDPEAILGRLWTEILSEPALSELVGLLPKRALSLADGIPVLMLVLTTPVLKGGERQLAVIDGLGRAYARARGLRFTEG